MKNIVFELRHEKTSLVPMRKPVQCLCENKGSDQLCSNCTADQRLFYATGIVQLSLTLNLKFQASSCTGRFMPDVVGT